MTWLYGPLHEHVEAVPPPKAATAADRYGLDENQAARSATHGGEVRFGGLGGGGERILGQGSGAGATTAAATEGSGGGKGDGLSVATGGGAAARNPRVATLATDGSSAPLVSSPAALSPDSAPRLDTAFAAAAGAVAGPSILTPGGGMTSSSSSSSGAAPYGMPTYVNNSGKKSILKHRTISEILAHPGRMASPANGELSLYSHPASAVQSPATSAVTSPVPVGVVPPTTETVAPTVERAVQERQAINDAAVAGKLTHPGSRNSDANGAEQQQQQKQTRFGPDPTTGASAPLFSSKSDTNLVAMGGYSAGSASPEPSLGAADDGSGTKSPVSPGRSGSMANRPAGPLANFSDRFLKRGESGDSHDGAAKRHISFNSRVEQCIAVDHEQQQALLLQQQQQEQQQREQQRRSGGWRGWSNAGFDPDEEEEDDEDDEDEDEEEDDGRHHHQPHGRRHAHRGGSATAAGDDSSDEDEDLLTMKSSPRTTSDSSLPLTNTSYGSRSGGYGSGAGGYESSGSIGSVSSAYSTIAMLAPTRLKTSEAFPSPSPAVVDPTGFTTGEITDWIQGGRTTGPERANSYPDPGHYGPIFQPGNASSASTASSTASSPTGNTSAGGTAAGNTSSASAATVASTATAQGKTQAGQTLATTSQWEGDDEFQSAGDFDYFSGPELGDDYSPAPGQAMAAGGGSARGENGLDGGHAAEGSSAFSPDGSSVGGSDAETSNAASSEAIAIGRGGGARRRAAPAHGGDDEEHSGAGSSLSPEDEMSGGAGGGSSLSRGAGSYQGADGQRSRGRTSQRLGSSASYERIQDAARPSRSRTNSGNGGTSLSPTGSYDGSKAAGLSSSPSNREAGSDSSPRNSRILKSGGSSGSAGKRGSDGASYATVAARHGFDTEGSTRSSLDAASPASPSSPQLGQNSDSDNSTGHYWLDEKTGKSKKASAARQKYQRSLGQSAEASASELSVDTANVPSNDPSSPQQVGPTPLNTPTFALARRSNKDGSDPTSPVMPRKPNSTGAVVAPRREDGVRVPLAHDYVDEDEGGLIGRAVEIVNTARDLIGALLGSSDRGRSWRE